MRQSASEPLIGNTIPNVPTLVLWGEADKFTKVSMAKQLADLIPNAKLQLMSNAGHMPQIEKPDEFVKIVNEFLTIVD